MCFHATRTAARTAIALAALAAATASTLGAVQPALAATRAAPFSIVGTEVAFRNGKQPGAAALAAALRGASADEARFYDPALAPAVMRVRIDKLGFKSGGKALAANLPVLGMFAGTNRNVMKGEVQLIDRATGKALRTFKVECDDDTDVSAADAALTYGKVGLSFLPFGGLVTAAMDVAEGAAGSRDRAEQMLTRGFVMLSYRKAYGDALYKSFSRQRKAQFALARLEKGLSPAPAPVVALPAPVTAG